VLVKRDGTDWRDLTNDKFFDRYPRWSPDGKQITFTSDRSGRYEIWVMNADGTNLRQVTAGASNHATFPLWSHDGARILFYRQSVNYLVDVNKGLDQTLQELPPIGTGDFFIAWDWSPDGKKLLGTNSKNEVVYFSFETNRYEKVVDRGTFGMWMGDSVRIVFTSQEKAYLADVLTKRVREIFTSPDPSTRNIYISADDQLLYFTLGSNESDIWLLDLP